MTNPTQPPTAETKAIQEAYDALNRNDLPGFLSLFAPDVARTEPTGFPGEGTHRGLEAFAAHAKLQRAKWAEGGCYPQRYLVAGDKVIAFVHVRVRLQGETGWHEGDIADGFAFRDGKATEFHTFVNTREAFEWAGVETPRAG